MYEEVPHQLLTPPHHDTSKGTQASRAGRARERSERPRGLASLAGPERSDRECGSEATTQGNGFAINALFTVHSRVWVYIVISPTLITIPVTYMHEFKAVNIGGRGDIEGRPGKLPELYVVCNFYFVI